MLISSIEAISVIGEYKVRVLNTIFLKSLMGATMQDSGKRVRMDDDSFPYCHSILEPLYFIFILFYFIFFDLISLFLLFSVSFIS